MTTPAPRRARRRRHRRPHVPRLALAASCTGAAAGSWCSPTTAVSAMRKKSPASKRPSYPRRRRPAAGRSARIGLVLDPGLRRLDRRRGLLRRLRAGSGRRLRRLRFGADRLLAARQRRPADPVHEQNAVLGLANRLLARRAHSAIARRFRQGRGHPPRLAPRSRRYRQSGARRPSSQWREQPYEPPAADAPLRPAGDGRQPGRARLQRGRAGGDRQARRRAARPHR